MRLQPNNSWIDLTGQPIQPLPFYREPIKTLDE